MDLKQLYEQYGQAMIQLEIAQNRASSIKKQIADLLNKNSSISEDKEA